MNINLQPTHQNIFQQMEKICSSDEFKTKLQLCKLLRYLVQETIEGREYKLKGYTIGLDVFNKEDTFDSDQDPLVRIHAGRLRRTLRMYYLEFGKNDPIIITIPKGKYIPVFHSNSREKRTKTEHQQECRFIKPSVAIMPFKLYSGNVGDEYFGIGLAEEVSYELTKFDCLLVYGSTPFANTGLNDSDKFNFVREKGVRFILEGGIHLLGSEVRIILKLIDSDKNEQIWAERYVRKLTPENIIEIQESIAQEISVILGSEYGIIFQRLSQESKDNSFKTIDSYNAILKFHYFHATHSHEALLDALASLKTALKEDSQNATIAALLASLYSSLYVLDLPTNEDAYKKLGFLTETALRLNPNNTTARIVSAIRYFVYNNKELFLKEVEHCLSLHPNSSTLRYGNLGQYLCLYGEWDAGMKILNKVMDMNVSFPLYFYGTTSLYFYKKKEYEKALTEAELYNMPTIFWSPLQRAACLAQLGRFEEATQNLEHLLMIKPHFATNACNLMGRCVKEPAAVEHLLEGLIKAGMTF